ncbi:MAG: FAD-dependent oxidoreductase [Clostridiales bacterium]|nr:FAD-dependent oxidoreductase [Clostridiales bacterium]
MKKYDVAVVGGGFTGVAAAIAAAREGSNVILIEKGNAFGGAAVNSLVNPFMPYTTKIDGEVVSLSAGIFEKIAKKLTERNATLTYITGRKLVEYSFMEEELKFILNDMVCEAGVDVLFHAYICKAEKDGEDIKKITVATKSGLMDIEADYFIDATGDAQLSYLAGVPTVLGRESDNLCQPMTLCFRLGNVDVEKFWATKKQMNEEYKEALERGEFINPRENVLAVKMPVPNVLHLNTTRVVKLDPTNPIDVSKAEIIARKQVYEVYEFMKKHGDGLENSYLMMTAPEIGVRESRKIVGDYILTETDARNCTKFDDAIAACNYDIDIHSPDGTGTSHYYFPNGEYYTIPYRSLIPKTVNNLLVAGRCISSDHGAQASYRVMSTVCCIGEAAGTAIGLAVKNKVDVRSVDVKELQRIIKDNGGFIGI